MYAKKDIRILTRTQPRTSFGVFKLRLFFSCKSPDDSKPLRTLIESQKSQQGTQKASHDRGTCMATRKTTSRVSSAARSTPATELNRGRGRLWRESAGDDDVEARDRTFDVRDLFSRSTRSVSPGQVTARESSMGTCNTARASCEMICLRYLQAKFFTYVANRTNKRLLSSTVMKHAHEGT